MKKTILMIFIGIAIFAFSTTSCKKTSAVDCVVQASEYGEATLDFIDDPTVSTCNALKKAANDYLKSCKKFMDADDIEEIEDALSEIGDCVA
jgi:hypothetical protein